MDDSHLIGVILRWEGDSSHLAILQVDGTPETSDPKAAFGIRGQGPDGIVSKPIQSCQGLGLTTKALDKPAFGAQPDGAITILREGP